MRKVTGNPQTSTYPLDDAVLSASRCGAAPLAPGDQLELRPAPQREPHRAGPPGSAPNHDFHLSHDGEGAGSPSPNPALTPATMHGASAGAGALCGGAVVPVLGPACSSSSRAGRESTPMEGKSPSGRVVLGVAFAAGLTASPPPRRCMRD